MALISCHNPASGAVVDLVVGDTLEVWLPQIAGTGYQWLAADVPVMLRDVGRAMANSLSINGRSARLPGAATDVVLTFIVTTTGEGNLSFDLARQWELDLVESITLVVKVGETSSPPNAPDSTARA
ncbi:MAG: protease inhibitor I42 family protein [Rhodoglobus sp.]